jgi:hypothetical protein
MPEKFRRYIHDLENRSDKGGDAQTIAVLPEDRDALQRAEDGQSRCLEIAGDHGICLWQARMSMSLRSVCEGH